MATVGYISVSTDNQNDDGQKLNILNFVNDHLKGGVDEWIEVKASTRKSAEKRKGKFRDIRIKRVNLAKGARIYGASWSTMKHFVSIRSLVG